MRRWITATGLTLCLLLTVATLGDTQGRGLYLRDACTVITNPVTGWTGCLDSTRGAWLNYDGTGWQSDVARATEVYNVKDPRFGAIGNGTTNDRAALAAADTAATAGTNGGTILFPPGTYKVSSALTFSSDVTLWFMRGAIIQPDSGITVTVSTCPQAGPQQIFGGSGTVTFAAAACDQAWAVWWGAFGDGTNAATAINAALTAINAAGGGDVRLEAGRTYTTTATVNLRAKTRLVAGGGPAWANTAAVIQPSSAVSIGVGTAAELKAVAIESITIDMVNMPVGAIGLQWDSVWNSVARRIGIFNLPDATAVGFDIVSTSASALYNLVDTIDIGTGGAPDQGIGFRTRRTGTGRVNALTVINARVANMTTGYSLNNSGSGNVFINCNAEGNSGDGVYIAATSAGDAAVQWIGGEVSGNGDYGFDGSTGRLRRQGVLMSTNTTGDVNAAGFTNNLLMVGVYEGAASLNFGNTVSGSYSDLTITGVTGAADTHRVALGIPNAAIVAAATGYYAWVSSADTVTVRFWNASGADQNPAAGTFRVSVFSGF